MLEQDERTFDPLEAYKWTKEFIDSPFYKNLFEPMILNEIALADYHAMFDPDVSTVYGWTRYKMALWKMLNQWLQGLLNPNE